MIKILVSLGMVLCSYASAQRYGIKAGPEWSTITNDEMNIKAGFYLGGFINYSFNEEFSLQTEILYNGAGAKFNDGTGDKLNLSYLSVPVLLQYSFLDGSYFEVGPQFSILLDSRIKENGNSIKSGIIKRFDFGIGLGLGYYITENLGISGRYVFGLPNIAKKIDNEQLEGRNNIFQAGLVYKFW